MMTSVSAMHNGSYCWRSTVRCALSASSASWALAGQQLGTRTPKQKLTRVPKPVLGISFLGLVIERPSRNRQMSVAHGNQCANSALVINFDTTTNKRDKTKQSQQLISSYTSGGTAAPKHSAFLQHTDTDRQGTVSCHPPITTAFFYRQRSGSSARPIGHQNNSMRISLF